MTTRDVPRFHSPLPNMGGLWTIQQLQREHAAGRLSPGGVGYFATVDGYWTSPEVDMKRFSETDAPPGATHILWLVT